MKPDELEKIINEAFENKQSVSENSDKELFHAYFSITKVVAFWTLFVGIFIVVLNVLLQDSNMPAGETIKMF